MNKFSIWREREREREREKGMQMGSRMLFILELTVWTICTLL